MEKLTAMLTDLEKGLKSIISAPEADRAGALDDQLAKFGNDLGTYLAEVEDEAFLTGSVGDIRKFVGTGDTLAKNIGHVAEFANLLRTAEFTVKNIERDGHEESVGQDIADGMNAWVKMGGGLLSLMVERCYGPPEDETPSPEEMAAAEAEKMAQLEGLAKAMDAEIARVNRLRKAEAAAPAAEGDEVTEEDVAEMNPLEVIGRLAAAIMVQVDALMPDDEEGEGEGQKEGDAETEEAPPAEKTEEKAPPAEAPEDKAPAEEAPAAPNEDEKKKNPFAAKSNNASDLKKAVDSEAQNRIDQLEKLVKELGERLNEKPAPAKGALKGGVVEKSADTNTGQDDELDSLAKRFESMSPEQRATELVKLSRRNPIRIG